MIDNIKVLAADIDMTLSAKGEGLPQATIDAFQVLHDNGVLIGLATGRVITEDLKHYGKNFWHLPYEFDFVIGMNGGMVYDTHTESMWATPLMTVEEMKDILTYMMPLIEKYHIAVNAEGGGNSNAMYIEKELIEVQKRHGWFFEDKTGDIDGFCEKPAYKFLFRDDPEHEQEIRDTFLKKYGDEWQIIGTYPGTVEVFKKNISKGNGLKKYCDDQNIDIKDAIAFGDNENDNSMLEMAGWGVCLKNGSDQSKAISDAVTDYDCEEGGVGHYLIDYYLKPKGLM